MVCPKCGEKFICKQDFKEHLEVHGVDPWRTKQLICEWDIYTSDNRVHLPDAPCKCRAYGNRFECELRVHKTS